MKIKGDIERRVRELYENGLSDYKIAKEVGSISPSTVWRWRKKNNLPPNPASGYKLKPTILADPIKLSYIAGLFDGEGSVYAGKYSRNYKTSLGIILDVEVNISNQSKEMLEKIVKWLGFGKVRKVSVSKSGRANYMLIFANQMEKLAFLEAIYPYLIAKKRRVYFAIKFLKSRLSKPPNTPFTNQELELINKIRRDPLYARKTRRK